MPSLPEFVSKTHRRLLILAAFVTAVLVALGGVVCATDASGGCPDWPRCHGELVPPASPDSILEYSHRIAAMLAGLLIVASAVAGWKGKRSGAALRILPTIAVILTGVVAVFGAYAVLTGLPPSLAAIDLGTALIVLALVVASATIASLPRFEANGLAGVQRQTALANVATLAALTTFIVIVSGVFVPGGSAIRCIGGPLFIGTWDPMLQPSWLLSTRQILGAAGLAFASLFAIAATRDRAFDATTLRWSVGAMVLLAIEAAHAVAMVVFGPTTGLVVLSAVVTTAAWSSLVIVAVRTHLILRIAPPRVGINADGAAD